ncbi:uncharacterized protein [Gossypium hirsutum]|uniref:Uncharacterized protein isoform X2 n=1 Tax=Gossypium hirsutum TaxID=3635 RepID=A0ABM3A0Z6_GOSHI|nr:uncharacterized protein LOC107903892 isoform X2 [Gossypium hirsutum]XP_040948549.1 uncharacterized protein LOC107903892 isoform X2 [Gossypium hirsutum]
MSIHWLLLNGFPALKLKIQSIRVEGRLDEKVSSDMEIDKQACKICETCRVVGAALIMVGLYLVILGKSEESKYLSKNEPIYSMSENNDMESTFIRPLLGNKLQS